jgi:hypothetical protein
MLLNNSGNARKEGRGKGGTGGGRRQGRPECSGARVRVRWRAEDPNLPYLKLSVSFPVSASSPNPPNLYLPKVFGLKPEGYPPRIMHDVRVTEGWMGEARVWSV